MTVINIEKKFHEFSIKERNDKIQLVREICLKYQVSLDEINGNTNLKKSKEYAFSRFDADYLLDNNLKTAFLDCGSNIGQGFKWFSSFYNGNNIKFYLFEPNPFCHTQLIETVKKSGRNATIFKKGIGTKNETVPFFGLVEDSRGKTSQGGSTVQTHNSVFYSANEAKAINVELINFAEFLKLQRKEFDQIIVKMDIEGAEIEVLNHLIKTETINLITILYVEFHSQYQKEPHKSLLANREKEIISELEKSNCHFRIWH